jgi:hypothetical protein
MSQKGIKDNKWFNSDTSEISGPSQDGLTHIFICRWTSMLIKNSTISREREINGPSQDEPTHVEPYLAAVDVLIKDQSTNTNTNTTFLHSTPQVLSLPYALHFYLTSLRPTSTNYAATARAINLTLAAALSPLISPHLQCNSTINTSYKIIVLLFNTLMC